MAKPDPFANLNEEQRLAVAHSSGPVLVIAGAGSGKTRVLTCRIAHLLLSGISAYNILAVTFTNKAASQMTQRVESLCGPQRELWIGTFHCVCARLLRQEISKLGMHPHFTIVDEQDQLGLIKEVLKDLNIDEKVWRPNFIRDQIGKAKNRLQTPHQLRKDSVDTSSNTIAAVYEAYQKKLFANNALDFDDLLMMSVQLFQQDAAVLARYREKFHHILIDEYQDTNHAQYVLVQLLAGDSGNVFAVGDEDQSIYSFRGAEIHNILDFERVFPNTTLYKLQQNYRSTGRILAAANSLIQNNCQRKGKNLWTAGGQGDKVVAFYAQDERQEVDFIVDTIRSLHADHDVPLEEMAIFYRIHALSRVVEEGLRKQGIPYEIIGGVGFYERAEIKDALAYLRVLVNPADSLSLKRILNVPPRGIGPSSLVTLNELSSTRGIPLFKAMETALAMGILNRKAAEGIRQLLGLIQKGAQGRAVLGITGTLLWVLEESGYRTELLARKGLEERTRAENLQELASATQEFEANHPWAALEDFLNDVALWTDLDRYSQTDQKVTLMTLHTSKGLEFSCAFIAGLEENIFPYSYWGMKQDDLEEERRLLYVGMTRAKQKLFLSCARNRLLFGSRKEFEPSRFLVEIEGEFVQKHALHRVDRDDWDEDSVRQTHPVSLPACRRANFDFREGEMVVHEKFGPGKILNCFDKGENLKVAVKFQSEEHPRLLAVKYARLQKANSL